MSYDYGKSFKKISEKLNFGVGNSSEAVIAQFYHSPADNKRVRKRCPTRCDSLGLDSIRDDCSAKGGAGRRTSLSSVCSLAVTVFLLTLGEHGCQGGTVHNQGGQVPARQDF